jgi:anti-sigma regulatory factor (Ser/Thr protein kinase)
MEDLSLHILDIAENAVAAGARTIVIAVNEDAGRDLLSVDIEDDGGGMSPEIAAHAADPFYTTRTTRRVGLGLALLREAAAAANGTLEIRSAPGAGTAIRATFQLSHIDCKPLGSMAETIMTLVAAPADIDIRYRHTRNDRTVLFDTREFRHQLAGLPLKSARALSLVRECVRREEDLLAQ